MQNRTGMYEEGADLVLLITPYVMPNFLGALVSLGTQSILCLMILSTIPYLERKGSNSKQFQIQKCLVIRYV